MATLARPATSAATTSAPLSLPRAFQLIEQLEDGFARVIGDGVISGGQVTKVSGYTVRLAANTVVFAEGKALALAATQDYTAAEASTTVYLWGVITRTAASSSDPTALDTYALTLSHNLTGTAPSSAHFPLAILTTDGVGVTGINDAPAGKYLLTAQALALNSDVIAAGEGAVVPAGKQTILFQKLQVRGTLTIRGRVKVEGL